MVRDDKKNQYSRKEERELRRTSSCKQPGGCPGTKIPMKNIPPFKSVGDLPGEIVKRERGKVRYEKISQKGFDVDLPKKDDEEKVIHNEELYIGGYEKKAEGSKEVEQLKKDIGEMNKTRLIETKTVKPENKESQYSEKGGTGFRTATKKKLEETETVKKRPAYLKESEGFKKPKGEEEYKFRSTREDEKKRLVGSYNKEGGGEIITIDKEKRGEALRELSKNRKKAARIKSSPEKLEKYYKRKGVTEKVTF